MITEHSKGDLASLSHVDSEKTLASRLTKAVAKSYLHPDRMEKIKEMERQRIANMPLFQINSNLDLEDFLRLAE